MPPKIDPKFPNNPENIEILFRNSDDIPSDGISIVALASKSVVDLSGGGARFLLLTVVVEVFVAKSACGVVIMGEDFNVPEVFGDDNNSDDNRDADVGDDRGITLETEETDAEATGFGCATTLLLLTSLLTVFNDNLVITGELDATTKGNNGDLKYTKKKKNKEKR